MSTRGHQTAAASRTSDTNWFKGEYAVVKVAFSNLACPEWSVDEVFQYAAQFGFDGVELRLLGADLFPSRLESSVQQHIQRLSESTGLDIVGLGASTRFATEDRTIWAENVEELRRFIDLAAALKVPMIRTFGGGIGAGCESSDRAVDCVSEALNAVSGEAERAGVNILLETHDEFSHSWMVRDVMTAVSSTNVGCIWDVHHPYRMDESVDETFLNLFNRLGHVHLKDAKRQGDDWDLVCLGEGEVPVRAIVRTLLQVQYEGYFSIEWERKWHPTLEPALTALPKQLAVLKQYMNEP